jgi:hypothetical protein
MFHSRSASLIGFVASRMYRSKPLSIVIVSLLLALTCARETIDRDRWQHMTHDDRILYVRSLIGAEKVKDAKGGGGRTYDRPAEDYVTRIDQAYARGDARTVPEIFAELGR